MRIIGWLNEEAKTKSGRHITNDEVIFVAIIYFIFGFFVAFVKFIGWLN